MGARMKKAILILLAAAAAYAQGADPYVGYIYPCGIQAGTTNRLVVGGQFLWGVRTGAVSGGGVKIIDVELVPGFPPPTGSQFRYLAKWLDAIAKGDRTEPPLPTDPNARVDEWRSNRWWRVLGTLDEQKLSIVARATPARDRGGGRQRRTRRARVPRVRAERDVRAASAARHFRAARRGGALGAVPPSASARPRRHEPPVRP